MLLAVYAWHGHVSERVLWRAAGRPAIQFRQLHYRFSRVSLLEIDLACPGVRVEVAARDAARRWSGCSDGTARTLPDWCRATGAIGGINGGFFGRARGPSRKEIVGLLKLDGELFGRAPRYRARDLGLGTSAKSKIRNPKSKIVYAHSALGFDRQGRPAIGWIVSDPRRPSHLLAFDQPEGLRGGVPWEVHSGLSGGPRLITRGRIAVSDRAERLASRGALPRTFVAYATEPECAGTPDHRTGHAPRTTTPPAGPGRLLAGRPRYLVLGVATAMTFQDAAQFLDSYFHRFHGLSCAEAMSLDGGPSSQLAYRAGEALYAPQASDISVPTCVLVYADDSSGQDLATARSDEERD